MMNKKGDLSLSITAIVVIVIAFSSFTFYIFSCNFWFLLGTAQTGFLS